MTLFRAITINTLPSIYKEKAISNDSLKNILAFKNLEHKYLNY